MDSLTIIWVIVIGYLVLNLAVGVYSHIRVKNSADYLLAGRRIGVLMTAGTLSAVQITATATIISVLTGMSTEASILLCGGILVLYTMFGGMWSVTLTDVIHFFVLVGGFSLAVPFVLEEAGGWHAVVA